MLNESDDVRLLRHILTCLIVIAFCCVAAVLWLLFPEYAYALRRGVLFLVGVVVVAVGVAVAAGALSKAASLPAAPTSRSTDDC